MGLFSSDEEQLIKNTENSGSVNNNLVLSGDGANFVQIILLILTLLRLIEIIYIVYTSHVKRMKKKYNGQGMGQI